MDTQLKARLPIAQLNPAIDSSSSIVLGVVTIIWPYSSSRQTTSILLVEPDFRLRQEKGQIRVTFRGASAKAVAKSGLTSGDEVVLHLEGAVWLENALSTGTPGRAVDWELRFGRTLKLVKLNTAGHSTEINVLDSSPSPEVELEPRSPPRTPATSTLLPEPRTYIRGPQDTASWVSPAIFKRISLPPTSVLFTDKDLELADEWIEGRPPKRTKFGRTSGQWRFADRTPSPEKEVETEHGSQDEGQVSTEAAQPGMGFEPSKPMSPAHEEVRSPLQIDIYVGEKNEQPLQFTEDTIDTETKSLPVLPSTVEGYPDVMKDALPVEAMAVDEDRMSDESIQTPHSDIGGVEAVKEVHKSSDNEVTEATEAHVAVDVEMPLITSSFSSTEHYASHLEDLESEERTLEDTGRSAHEGNLQEAIAGSVNLQESETRRLESFEISDDSRSEIGSSLDDSLILEPDQEVVDLHKGLITAEVLETEGVASAEGSRESVVDYEGSEDGLDAAKSVVGDEAIEDKETELVIKEEFAEQKVDAQLPGLVTEVVELASDDEDDASSASRTSGLSDWDTLKPNLQGTSASNLGEWYDTNGTDLATIVEEQDVSGSQASNDAEAIESAEDEPSSQELVEDDQRGISSSIRGIDDVEEAAEVEEPKIDAKPPSQDLEQDRPLSKSSSPVVSRPPSPDHKLSDVLAAETLDESTVPNRMPFLSPEPSGIQEEDIPTSPHHVSEEDAAQELRNVENQLVTPQATQLLENDNELAGISDVNKHTELSEQTLDVTAEPSELSPILPGSKSPLVGEKSPPIQNEVGKTVVEEELLQLDEISTKDRGDAPKNATPTIDEPDEKTLEVRVPDVLEEGKTEVDQHDQVTSDLGEEKPQSLDGASEEEVARPEILESTEASHSTGFRTPLSFFASLSSLEQYFNCTVDVLTVAISSTKPSRAKSGPRHMQQSLHLIDRSIQAGSSSFIIAQLFRPSQSALPLLQSGDVVLLRDFKVQSQKRKMMLISTDSSAWAVFRHGQPPQMRGPPVEFGEEEEDFAEGLLGWWSNREGARKTRSAANAKLVEGSRQPGKRRSRVTGSPDDRHVLRDGTTYIDGDKHDDHELRDGRTYTDR